MFDEHVNLNSSRYCCPLLSPYTIGEVIISPVALGDPLSFALETSARPGSTLSAQDSVPGELPQGVVVRV